jgi:type II secretory pathway pseudopilin PulG
MLLMEILPGTENFLYIVLGVTIAIALETIAIFIKKTIDKKAYKYMDCLQLLQDLSALNNQFNLLSIENSYKSTNENFKRLTSGSGKMYSMYIHFQIYFGESDEFRKLYTKLGDFKKQIIQVIKDSDFEVDRKLAGKLNEEQFSEAFKTFRKCNNSLRKILMIYLQKYHYETKFIRSQIKDKKKDNENQKIDL